MNNASRQSQALVNTFHISHRHLWTERRGIWPRRGKWVHRKGHFKHTQKSYNNNNIFFKQTNKKPPNLYNGSFQITLVFNITQTFSTRRNKSPTAAWIVVRIDQCQRSDSPESIYSNLFCSHFAILHYLTFDRRRKIPTKMVVRFC